MSFDEQEQEEISRLLETFGSAYHELTQEQSIGGAVKDAGDRYEKAEHAIFAHIARNAHAALEAVSTLRLRLLEAETQRDEFKTQVQKAADYAAGYEAGITACAAQLPHVNPHDATGTPESWSGWESGWAWMADYIAAQRLPHATARATAAEACLRRLVRAVALEARNPDRNEELDETNSALAEAGRMLAAVAVKDGKQ
jgi:hypothetical protein